MLRFSYDLPADGRESVSRAVHSSAESFDAGSFKSKRLDFVETTPILLVASGLFLIASTSVLIRYVYAWRKIAGYSELRRDVPAIESFLGGETYRAGNDLVITGNIHGYRTTLRFSRDENTPGVNLRMEAPATFDLMIVPKNSGISEGGERILTGNGPFDANWIIRSNHSLEARMFLAGDTALTQIRNLCCSSNTLVSMERGAIELSEQTVPEGSPRRHLIAHLESMGVVAKQLSLMPGAGQVKTQRVVARRPTGKVFVTVIAAAAVCLGIAALASYQHTRTMNAATAGVGGSPQGISADEASYIPDLRGWRLAGSSDFDPSLVQWMHDSDVVPRGRLEGDFLGGGPGNDHAYLLMNAEGSHRLVMVIGNQVKFDQTFPTIALVAKIPKTAIRNIKIDTGSPATGNSDGILLVRDKSNLHSSLVLSLNGDSLVTAVPENYKATTLK